MRKGLVVFLCICLTACLLLGRAEQAVSAVANDQAKSQPEDSGKSGKPGKKTARKGASDTKGSGKTGGSKAGKGKSATKRNKSKDKSERTKAPPAADQDQRKPLSKLAVVKGVEQVSGKDYSRIVISLSGEVQFHYQLLPPDPKSGNVRRIYVDMEDCRLTPRSPSRLKVSSGLMRKVRVSPYKPGVIRVVVEVENLRTWKVFTLPDPFRVVVDVQGEVTKSASSKRGGKSKKKGAVQEENDAKAEAAQAEACAQAEEKRAANPRYKLPPACRKMAKKLVEQLGLTVSTVMVDAGHGGKDPGAHAKNGLLEKTVTLRLAKMVGERLARAGVNVLYTRTSDRFVPLENRTGMANAKKADLFLSIHCNASPDVSAAGLETYSLNLATTPEEVRVAARENAVDPKRISDMRDLLADLMLTSRLKESRDFARSAHQGAVGEARKRGLQRDRGLHEAPFYVLMGANMPAVLIEVGYITNPAEAEKLNSKEYLEKLADGIADGVLAYKARLDHKTGG